MNPLIQNPVIPLGAAPLQAQPGAGFMAPAPAIPAVPETMRVWNSPENRLTPRRFPRNEKAGGRPSRRSRRKAAKKARRTRRH